MSEVSLKFIIDDVKQSNAVSNQTSFPASHETATYSIDKKSKNKRQKRRRRMRRLVWAIVFLAVVAASVTYLYNDRVLRSATYVPIGVGQVFVNAENSLGLKSVNYAYSQGLKTNILIAPSSLAAPLSFIYTNTNPQVRNSLQRLLAFNGMNNNAVKISNQTILNSLASPSGSTLHLNNNLWINNKSSISPAYTNAAKNYYHLAISNLDFSSPAAVASINSTIRHNIASGSVNVSSLIGGPESALLASSSYFTDQWQYGFNVAKTKNAQFATLSGKSVTVPFMRQTNVFNYYEAAGLQAIQLPFGADGNLVMNVYMPNDLTSFMSKLSLTTLADINAKFNQYDVSLALPRFNVSYQANLDAVLKGMGMSSLFSSGLANNQISPSVHLTDFITLNRLSIGEQGVGGLSQNASSNNAAMTVNRPFLFTIVDNASGNFVMVGIVSDPTQ